MTAGHILRFGFPLLGGATIALAFSACSSSDATQPSADASTQGTGGKGTGGKSGSTGGNTSGTGGSTTGDGASQYVCEAKPPIDPGKDGAEGSTCCLDFGTCVKPSTITDPVQLSAFGHDSCKAGTGDSDLKCAPTASALADAGTLGVYDTCTANLGSALEGRCLPKCFVLGNPQASLLKQEGCKNAELVCAPCFSPVDGKATGACSQKAGDKPTTQPPTPFPTCGATDSGPALGVCVPKQLALDTGNPAASMLVQLDCASATDVCAPALKVKNPNECFPECTSIAGPGACVAAFLVEAVQPGGSTYLNGQGCQGGELCAPCLNPLSTPPNQPTGACN